MSKITETIAKNTFFNSITQIVGFLSALLLSIITARLLGPSRFGSYTLVTFTLTVAELLSSLGLANLVAKYLAEFSGDENKEIRSGILFYAIKIKFIATLIVVFTLIAFSRHFANFYSDIKLVVYIIVSAIGLLPAGMAMIFSSAIMGLQKYKYLAYRALVISPLQVILALLILKMGYGVIGLVSVNVVVSIIAFLFYFSLLRIKIGFEFHFFALPLEIKKKLFQYNWQLALIVLVDAIIWRRSEVFFLGRFHPPSEVAYYGLAYGVIERTIIFLPLIFTGVLMPAISELYGKRKNHTLQKVYINSLRYISMVSVPICVTMMLLARPLIGLLYGKDYLPAIPVLQILIISGCAYTVGTIQASVLYGTENQRYILKWNVFFALGNLMLDFILIPRFGAVGAAFANSSVQVIAIIIGVIIVCRLLSVTFPFQDFFKIVFSSTIAIPAIILITKANNGIIGVSLSLVTSLVVYFGMITFVKLLNKTDLTIIHSLIKKIPEPFHKPSMKVFNLIAGDAY